jgi:hypothetical protein
VAAKKKKPAKKRPARKTANRRSSAKKSRSSKKPAAGTRRRPSLVDGIGRDDPPPSAFSPSPPEHARHGSHTEGILERIEDRARGSAPIVPPAGEMDAGAVNVSESITETDQSV